MKVLPKMISPIGITRRLLGQILLDGEFVSRDELQAAIEHQRKTSARIGDILVGMGALSEAELEAVLLVQQALASPQDAIKVAAGVRELLGELLVRAKRLTPESLQEALAEQNRTGEKLGTVLVRSGLITESECDAVLAFQKRQSSRKARLSPLRLGEILVRNGAITREKLEQALERKKLSRRKIGDILVESGYIKPDELNRGIRLQQKLLTATLVGMLALAAVPSARAFDLPTSRSEAKMTINITAEVKARTSMKILRHVHEIVVNDTDLAAPAPSLIDVKSNSPVADLRLAAGDHDTTNIKF